MHRLELSPLSVSKAIFDISIYTGRWLIVGSIWRLIKKLINALYKKS